MHGTGYIKFLSALLSETNVGIIRYCVGVVARAWTGELGREGVVMCAGSQCSLGISLKLAKIATHVVFKAMGR